MLFWYLKFLLMFIFLSTIDSKFFNNSTPLSKFDSFLDHSGAIGRRYRRLDEIGAPFAITVDHQTKEDNTVTIRRRDDMAQERVNISELESILAKETAYP